MTDPVAARSFLVSEVESLEPFDFVAVVPDGQNLQVTEAARREDGGLEVRVPGRPRVFPELELAVRSALRERGFSSDDPSDPTEPWVCGADDAGSAVTLLQDVLVEVFGAKREAKLDLGHGSHRSEHEVKQKLALARTRIEAIVTDLLEKAPERDDDGDYVLPIGQVHVMVAPRATPDAQVVIRIFAITNVDVNVTPDLGLFLARMNFGLMFGRFALDAEHRAIWFDESLLGEQFREEELRFAIHMVSSTADGWDDRLKQMFGGIKYQEVLEGASAKAAPPIKPGEGTGMYL
jgi:T3SS (YopN, CesT) and YbjN peptide-binding chaperone 1